MWHCVVRACVLTVLRYSMLVSCLSVARSSIIALPLDAGEPLNDAGPVYHCARQRLGPFGGRANLCGEAKSQASTHCGLPSSGPRSPHNDTAKIQ